LGVEALVDCALEETGDDYTFKALGRGFQVSLYYYDVHGQRQDFGLDSQTVRVVASLEPDPNWDEDHEDSPLAMEWIHGRNYRFPTLRVAEGSIRPARTTCAGA